MTRIIAILAAVFVLGDVGLAAALYLQTHQAAPASETQASVVAHSAAPKNSVGDPDFDKRQAAALNIITRSRDWADTGDANGVAQWSALDDRRYPTLCGITPTRRYYIVQNQIGSTRYDEQPDKPGGNFENIWNRIGCERTTPVHQQEILAAAARKELYDETHPIDPDCLEKQMKEFDTADKATLERNAKDDCRRPISYQ